MTREEFIVVLEEEGYSYIEEGNKLVVTYGYVDLSSLQTLPPGVEFKNVGYVNLYSLKTLPPGVVFKNGGDVYLYSLKTISPGVEFKNGGNVLLESLVGEWIEGWKGNIEGIDSKMLLNLMINKGMFI